MLPKNLVRKTRKITHMVGVKSGTVGVHSRQKGSAARNRTANEIRRLRSGRKLSGMKIKSIL